MDQVKLDRWKKRFIEEAKSLQIEFDAFFRSSKLDQYYELRIDETCEELEVIIQESLPHDIKERLIQVLAATKPEDSV